MFLEIPAGEAGASHSGLRLWLRGAAFCPGQRLSPGENLRDRRESGVSEGSGRKDPGQESGEYYAHQQAGGGPVGF